MNLKVTHFARRPTSGAFSIERVFADVRSAMPAHVTVTEQRNTHFSQGIMGRLRDAWSARRRQAADVNHVTGDVHYLTYFLPKARTVLTVHDTVMVDRARGLKRVLLWFFWFWLPARRVGWMTAISEETKRRLLDMISFDPDRVVVIPNPVSSDFAPSPLPPREGAFRLLHIGTKANKNLERLVPALDGLEVELTVLGRMTERQKALIAEHRISCRALQGLDDDGLRAEYARTEALVFVSLDEGFGLPIVEAQASGRPVVTSNRPPMNEVAGDGALLVDPEDPAAIRAAVTRVVAEADLRRDLVDRGVRNAERYSARAIACAYGDLYARVAGEKEYRGPRSRGEPAR